MPSPLVSDSTVDTVASNELYEFHYGCYETMKWVIHFLYFCSLFPVLLTIKESTAFSTTPPTLQGQWDAPSTITTKIRLDMNHPKNSPLSERYESIVQQTETMTKPWPDSDGFANCCLYSRPDDTFEVPRFPKGTGPLGVFALTRDNTHPGNQELVQTCLDSFDQFSKELDSILKVGIQDHFFLVPSLVPHITVAIFQEHPQLLRKKKPENGVTNAENGETEDNFHFFSDQEGQTLAQNLANHTSHFAPIQLSLHSLMLTSDGAMIAGFVDDDDNLYGELKTEILEGAEQVMGAHRLTSRPKNLIHITCGRVVRKHGSRALEESTQAAIKNLVDRYNGHVFPQIVGKMKTRTTSIDNDGQHSTDGTFLLDHMTLLRNDVWLCEHNTVYGIGKLQG